jgi:hypothetical protein
MTIMPTEKQGRWQATEGSFPGPRTLERIKNRFKANHGLNFRGTFAGSSDSISLINPALWPGWYATLVRIPRIVESTRETVVFVFPISLRIRVRRK